MYVQLHLPSLLWVDFTQNLSLFLFCTLRSGSVCFGPILLAPLTEVAPSGSQPRHLQARGRHQPTLLRANISSQGQYAWLLRDSHGSMKPQGSFLGMNKLTRAFILGDLDRADRIDTALVKIAPSRGRLTSNMPKTKRGARGELELDQIG